MRRPTEATLAEPTPGSVGFARASVCAAGRALRGFPAAGGVSVDQADLRYAAAAVVGAGAVLPLLSGHVGLVCPLRAATGVPCPLCGMTTSVGSTLRLDLESALAATPAGVVAVVTALVLLLVRPRRLSVPAPLVYVALGAMWLYQLHRFSFL